MHNMGTVVKLAKKIKVTPIRSKPTTPKPRTFTEREEVIEYLAEKIITDNKPYRVIAKEIGVSDATIGNIARRHTLWPRPNTLFSLIQYYKLKMQFIQED